MEWINNSLHEFFLQHPNQFFYVKEVNQYFPTESASDFKTLVKALVALEEEGLILLNKDGKYGMVQQEADVEGTYRANEKGFGFVTIEEGQADIFIPRGKTLTAMEGDWVKVKLTKSAKHHVDKSAEGQVIEIVRRNVTQVVGIFTRYPSKKTQETGYYGEVALADKKFATYSCLVKDRGLYPVDGTVVVVEVTDYPDANSHTLQGLIIKEIGYKDAVGMDILTILYQLGIPTEFPEQVIEEANKIPETLSDMDLEGRRDLRDQLTITIDGADAKDLDDAIALEKRSDGTYILTVSIADVSYYVSEHSALDQEAYRRATSVYVTDRVVPMLPQRLSNGLCSLHPQEDRLTMTCQMEIDQSGTIYHHEIFPSIIRSDERMTYDTVNRIYAGEELSYSEQSDLIDMLWSMKELHEILERRRKARGAIDFETHESKIIVDEKGRPTDILVRERGISERLIESFMLAANETVAMHFTQLQLPFLYRIHEHPKEEKMHRFLEFITAFGVVIRGKSDEISPKKLQKALEEVKGETYEAVVSKMMLRSMKQAKYAIEPNGHYGLAAEDYTHFTSPIRRYPDLIVHRMIRYYSHVQNRIMTDDQRSDLEKRLADIAEQSSKMERLAVQAERETDALKKAEFMQDKIGQVFDAIISSVTRFGIFVELPNTVEGLIHLSQIKEDYFNFVESHMVLIGERTGRSFRIGDRVKVKLVKVEVASREIDFILEESADLEESMQTYRQKKTQEKRHRRSQKLNHQEKKHTVNSKRHHKKRKNKGKSKRGFTIRNLD